MTARRQAALALALVAALASCSRTRKGDRPDTGGGKEKPEAPDRPQEKGVPPAAGRPRIPAAPEALLAEGAVGRIQRALSQRGLLDAHREGELDAPTSAAIRKFQEREGLAATGFPDRETLRKLGIDPESAYVRQGDKPR